MSYDECVVVSAYTGFLMCDFDDLHRAVEERLCRPVWTHEFGEDEVIEEIRKAFYEDFIALCQHRPEV